MAKSEKQRKKLARQYLRGLELSALTYKEREFSSRNWIAVGASFDFLDPNNWYQEQIGSLYLDLSNRIDCFCEVDEIDYYWAKQWNWCHTYSSTKGRIQDCIYARRAVHTPWGNRTIWLHRQICERALGPAPSPTYVCDHLNGDTLCNKRENLRWATQSENSRNVFGQAWLQLRLL